MEKTIKEDTPFLAIILSLLAVSYTFSKDVVVIPLVDDAMPSGVVSGFNSKTYPSWLEELH